MTVCLVLRGFSAWRDGVLHRDVLLREAREAAQEVRGAGWWERSVGGKSRVGERGGWLGGWEVGGSWVGGGWELGGSRVGAGWELGGSGARLAGLG